MSNKVYDIVATVGEYTDREGNQKKQYLNVGVVLKGDNGPYIMLNKTFNPAGLAEPGRTGILLGLFEPREREGQKPAQAAPAPQAAPPAAQGFDDDVPF